MNKIEYLQSQKLITEAQILALKKMQIASAFEWKIALEAGLVEVERQIAELEMGDIL